MRYLEREGDNNVYQLDEQDFDLVMMDLSTYLRNASQTLDSLSELLSVVGLNEATTIATMDRIEQLAKDLHEVAACGKDLQRAAERSKLAGYIQSSPDKGVQAH